MRGRPENLWWGAAIEAPDPAALAAFYSRLLDWPVAHQEPGTAIIKPPVWPPAPGQQRTMMHLDIQVEDLEAAVADAVALGARVAEYQPQDNVRVLLDPAGHPFCLCRDDEG